VGGVSYSKSSKKVKKMALDFIVQTSRAELHFMTLQKGNATIQEPFFSFLISRLVLVSKRKVSTHKRVKYDIASIIVQ